MAFPTEPELPRWATTSPPAAPSSGQQDSGWVSGQTFTKALGDWLANRAYTYLVYLKDYLDVDHDPTDGHHDTVHVKTELLVEASNPIAYEQGIGTPYFRVVTIPLGSYDKGGWVVISGTPVINSSATPPNTGLAAGAGTLVTMTSIPLIVGDGDTTGAQWVLTDFAITYKRVGTASNAYSWKLRSQLADGTGAWVDEASGSLTSATITRATVSLASEAVNPALRYVCEITQTQGGGAAAAEVVTANVDAVTNRYHLD